jgi:hypothetical protein
MDFHPATGATVVQVISSAITALKNARDLAKDSKDRELKEVIGNAFDLLLDLKERMLALDEENRDLKTQLAKKALITGPVPPFGYLYEKTDEAQQHPLCPRCYQEKLHVYTLVAEEWDGGTMRRCPNCHWLREEDTPWRGRYSGPRAR